MNESPMTALWRPVFIEIMDKWCPILYINVAFYFAFAKQPIITAYHYKLQNYEIIW